MQSVAKFVTKAYPVSGCFDYLSEVRTGGVCVRARTCVTVALNLCQRPDWDGPSRVGARLLGGELGVDGAGGDNVLAEQSG